MYISLLYNYFVGYYATGSQAEREIDPDRNRWRKHPVREQNKAEYTHVARAQENADRV